MATSSATEKAGWHEGDCCLAPHPWDGTLREATIQRLSSSHSKDSTAWVVFSDHGKDAAEENEEAVPVSKLLTPGLNDFRQEKPLFPGIVTPLAACVPMELSAASGEKVPFTINRYLRDYQREGIRFLYHNYMQSRGCILGDDMGLGKTVQVIGFLAAVLHKTGKWKDIENNRPQFLLSQMPSKLSKPDKVFLIVAPLSVLYNWKDELDTWGHFQCVVVHGLRKDEELARIKKRRFEVALTTYETLRLCLDQFNSIDWSTVIVDEAHKIKNPNSQITQAMKELRCHIRIGLTGTILQNNLEELWCVMDWAIPGCLGSLGCFKNKFADPIEKGQRHTATKRALATGRKTVRALAKMISPWFLRRTKALIKEQLPKKNDKVVYCTLTDFQRTVYQTVLDTQDVTLLLRSSEKCHCQSGRTRRSCCYKTNSDGVQMKALYFSYLAILRKVANHVALLQSTAGTSKKQEKFVNAICENVFQKFPDFVQRCKEEAFEALSDPMYSGKMKVLQKLLKFYMQKRDKVLLFSLSTKLLDVLESYCMSEGLDYSRLDGTTKAKERVQIVKEFNSSSHVNLCLVSTMAGGLGLNFVGANVVVLFDPTWNPANDLQAIDRAYRIGQCRDVTVLRLISLGTVEETIYLRQIYKQQLQSSVVGKESSRRYFEAVQGDGGHKGELFGIKNLFRLQTQGTCLTRKIIEREGQVEAGVMTTITHTGKEKEEESKTKNVGEHGGSVQTNVPAPATEYKDTSNIPVGVLDFSSGSEVDESEEAMRRKTLDPNTVDSTAGGNVASGPGRLSLLQHGFSRLLQRVRGKPELVEGDSSLDETDSLEDNTSEEDKNGPGKMMLKKDVTTSFDMYKNSNRGNGAVCVQKSRTNTWDISSGLDREDKGSREMISVVEVSDDAVRKRLGVKVQTKKTDEESNGNYWTEKKEPNNPKTVSKVQHYEGYSDESEDLDIAAVTLPKKDAFNSCNSGVGRGKVDSNKKRHSARVRDKARYKYTEETETFTSSDDEHTPAKRKRSRRCHITTPQTERRKEELPRGYQGFTAVNRRRSERQPEMTKEVSFTGLKGQTSPSSQAKGVTIDSVLGGVQEVVYTHSNQRVVGGSKAEELISRAAVRDVFERKMYSQLPANHLLGTQQSLSASPPDSQQCPAAVRLVKPSVVQPVIFTNKSLHHNKSSTIIIGETPQAIRRQQLEEMAAKFQFPSVHQFAEEVLRTTSTKRLEWLQQYYIPLNHPELATTVTNNFPQPHSAQTSFSPAVTSSPPKTIPQTSVAKSHTRTQTPQKKGCQENSKKSLKCGQKTPRPLKKPRISKSQNKMSKTSQGNVLDPQKKILLESSLDPVRDVLSSESEEQKETVYSAREEKKTKTCGVLSSVFGAGDSVSPEQVSRSSLKPEEAAAAFKDQRGRGTSFCPELSHPSSPLSKPTAQKKEEGQESSSCTCGSFQNQSRNPDSLSSPVQAPSTCTPHSLLTDLIGDTSILDDLLRPKPRASPKAPPASSLVSANAGLAVASPPSVTLKTDSSSKAHLDSASSSRSHTPGRHQDPPTTQASKGSRKDFWDILNEGNEERINKLTDLSQVHRVCINTSVAAQIKSGQEDRKTLWKSNENFLWKK